MDWWRNPWKGRTACGSDYYEGRRGNTRWNCDWSSDVCSSDLAHGFADHAGHVHVLVFPVKAPGIERGDGQGVLGLIRWSEINDHVPRIPIELPSEGGIHGSHDFVDLEISLVNHGVERNGVDGLRTGPVGPVVLRS